MSLVTGWIIVTSTLEDYTNDDDYTWGEDLNDWIKDNWKIDCGDVVKIDDVICLGKHPQFIARGAGCNYFPNDSFINWFKNYPWKNPTQVFLIFNPEEGPIQIISPRI